MPLYDNRLDDTSGAERQILHLLAFRLCGITATPHGLAIHIAPPSMDK